MRASIALIDKARSLCEPPTDYQLAKRLGINHATLSRCRHRGGTLDNEAASKLADLLGQDRYTVIAVMEVERAKTPQKKAFWEQQLPRVMPVVAALGITAGVTYITVKGLTTVEAISRLIHYAKYLYIRPVRRTGFALAS